MNLKMAKRLRKAARLTFAAHPHLAATRYVIHRIRKVIMVDPQCERGLYLRLKGAVN